MILVTGGAGFIGSHTCIALAQAGVPYLILDNFCNSRRSVLERLGASRARSPNASRAMCAMKLCLRACSRSTPLTA